MHVNYLATEGVKTTGSEAGVWLTDGVDNSSQIIINKNNTWTESAGAGGGTISVTDDVITITQGTAAAMFVTTAFTCTIGQIYSVTANILSSDTTANIRISDRY